MQEGTKKIFGLSTRASTKGQQERHIG